MRIIPWLWVLLLGFSVTGYSQDFTNKGKEFWLGYGNHQQMYDTKNCGMSVYVTADVSTSFTIDIGGVPLGSYNIAAGQVIEVPIPKKAFLDEEKVYTDRGIHVVAQKPVVAYAHIYYASVSGATLCLPVTTLGVDYYSLNFTQVAQANLNNTSYSYFFVVATEDNTTVEITPSANTITMQAGQTKTVTLNKGDIFNALSLTDLTGSIIKSVSTAGGGCKKIAVFCGSGRIGIGCTGSVPSSDNLFQQMYPGSTWGKKYVTAPSANRPMNYYRVVRPDAATTVKVDGSVIPSSAFIDNFYYQFNDVRPHVIEADKPILVAQYYTTESCGEPTNNGDPEMIYLNPVEQTISNVTLTSLRLINVNNNIHFINVVVKNAPGAINTFKIDGVAYPGRFITHPAAPEYAYAQIQVVLGNHTLTCDTPFNAIAYGFAQTESYGYSAGTNLKDLYQFITIQNEYAAVNFPASCKNNAFNFSMTFPYQPTLIAWRFNGLFPDETISSPVYDSTWVVNDKTLYRYSLPQKYNVAVSGSYPVTVIANNPTGNGCNGVQELQYNLEIYDTPVVKGTYQHTGCLVDSVSFVDIPVVGDRPAVSWFWNFGDGATSNLQNPKHLYASPVSNLPVTHWIINDIGCISAINEQIIGIAAPPKADFSMLTAICQNKDVIFKNTSTEPVGVLVKTTWDYGDGSTEVVDHLNPVKHIYTKPGTYSVLMQVQNNIGCKSLVDTQYVAVQVNPAANFGIPKVCVDDPFALLSDSSTISDGSVSQLTYQWSFGDGQSGTNKNPQHKYASAGTYTVQQTVTSKDGCTDVATKSLTINSGSPRAIFQVSANVTNNELCSADTISLTDASVIDIGNIIRTEIYWDYNNDPTNKTVDESPAQGKIYKHNYPAPTGTVGKTYQVRYVVYSGESCPNESRIALLVKPNPIVKFDNLQAVCEEVAPYIISTGTETLGLSGAGSYSGDGMASNGLFNPATAGAGIHAIKYSYTGINGCNTTVSRNLEVYPTPLADAGPDKGVLQGGYVILQGRAIGRQVSVSWSPNMYMNNNTAITPMVSPPDDITYTLTVTSADGCIAKDEVFVKYLDKIRVPNIFSPNGDGVHDTWVIQYLDSYTQCEVEVFNRYGQKVFNSTGYTKPWDGTQQGKPLPIGTYYWIINPKNGKGKLSGSVTIVR